MQISQLTLDARGTPFLWNVFEAVQNLAARVLSGKNTWLRLVLVTYRFYFFVGNLPKFGRIHRKRLFFSLQKIVLDNFPRNFFI